MAEAKGVKRRKVAVFTLDGRQYRVKANVSGLNLKQALSLRAIISAFETSVQNSNDARQKLG